MGNESSSSTSREAIEDIDTETVIDSIIKLMGDRQLKMTFKQTTKGTLVVSACTIIGGFVGGPLGLAAGASSGGLLAYAKTKGTFKSIQQIFNELPPERKKIIAYEAQSIVNKLRIKDWVEFVKIATVCASIASGEQKASVQEFIRQITPVIEKQFLEYNRYSGN